MTEQQVWSKIENVKDPEVPVLSIVDLGVVRQVEVNYEKLSIKITPTYSGCPAMQVIEEDIRAEFKDDFQEIEVELVYSPAWTTDWMTESGKVKLKEYGIAPPMGSADKSTLFGEVKVVPCPRCDSKNTKLVSQFGSTACKAFYQCEDCLEPFDYFKCL